MKDVEGVWGVGEATFPNVSICFQSQWPLGWEPLPCWALHAVYSMDFREQKHRFDKFFTLFSIENDMNFFLFFTLHKKTKGIWKEGEGDDIKRE